MTTRIKHLYVHVPFCRSICFYCDFAHRVYDEKLVSKWLDRLAREIEENCQDQYETIYIGGGTPSALNDRELEKLLQLIGPFSRQVKEYTIEVNPESLDASKADLFKKYGINRISMGVQSSDDQLLKSLNRKHTFADVKDGIAMLREKDFNNISVDLMYSLPCQDLDSLKKSLDDILQLNVEHISLYSLTIEENTVFGKRGVKAADEELEADMYEYIEECLCHNGYEHYEIANFCKPGKASRHNLAYWRYEDFLGVSAGAAGKTGAFRYTNTRDIARYISADDIRDEKVYLSKDDQRFENIMMSLRTAEGLDLKQFNERYDCDFVHEYAAVLRDQPSLVIKDDHLICENREILNTILLAFLP